MYIVLLLPLAAILLRLSSLMSNNALAVYGEIIYSNLPFCYAMVIAYGFSKDHSGIAVFSAAIGYKIFEGAYLFLNVENDMYILGGIVVGTIVSFTYNRIYDYQFRGAYEILNNNRHIPIITSVMAYIVGLIVGQIWPFFARLIESFSIWIAGSGLLGGFMYGLFNRLLLPFGLHHNLNHYLWYEYGNFNGVTGDLNRFAAGDPSAGAYLTGYYLVMMFGLPALMLAFYRNVQKPNRKMVKGLYLFSALIAIFTGITEPVELLFLFLMPQLFIIHALWTGLAVSLCQYAALYVGFDFSAGLIDFLYYYQREPDAMMILYFGILYAVIYYWSGKWFIQKTGAISPGDYVESENAQRKLAEDFIEIMTTAFGGSENIKYVHIKFTRFEFRLADAGKIDYSLLEQLKGANLIQVTEDDFQVITGNQGKYLKQTIKERFNEKVL